MINAIFELLKIVPISLLTIICAGNLVEIPENSILACILGIVFPTFFIALRHMPKKGRVLSVGIVMIFLLGIYFLIGKENRNIIATDYFWTLYCLLFSALSIVLGLMIEKWKWARRMSAIMILGLDIFFLIFRYQMTKFSVALSVFFILICILEEVQIHWTKEGYTDIRSHVTLSAPVILLLCLCVFLLPSPEKPYDWALAKRIYNSVSLGIKQLSVSLSHGKEDYASVGFSGEAGFFDRINNEKDQVIFTVSVDRDSIKSLYLVGTVADDFTDLKWSSTEGDNSAIRMLDTLETTTAIKKFDSDHPYDYMAGMNLKYENRYFNSRYAFLPAKTLIEPLLPDNPFWKEKEGGVSFDKSLKYSSRYAAHLYAINYNHPAFEAFLTSASTIEKKDWDKTVKYELDSGNTKYSYESYLAYKAEIHEKYAETFPVSERVENLLQVVRDNSENKYEELKNVEALLNTYTYTASPSKLPDTVTDAASFLDYMLFETKEGYCVHFATCFTLLARELGYPARFVQGYYLTRNKEAVVEVKPTNAHAWAEVYFENIGWIAFEPTPGFKGASGWKLANLSDQLANQPQYDPSTFLKDEDIPEIVVQEEAVEEGITTSQIIQIVKIVGIPLLGVLLFVILYLLVSRIIAAKRYERMPEKDKLTCLMQESMKLLKKAGYPIIQGETLSEYKERLLTEVENIPSLDYINFYEDLVYADKDISGDKVLQTEESLTVMRKLLRQKKGRRRNLSFAKK